MDDAVVQLQIHQLLAVFQGGDVLYLGPGQNQIFQVGHIGGKFDVFHGGVADVDAHHILAVAQVVNVLVLEIVFALLNGHELGFVGAGLALVGEGHRPDYLVAAAGLFPVGGHVLVFNAAAVHNQLLQLREQGGQLLGILNGAHRLVGDVHLGGVVGEGVAEYLHLPVDVHIGIFGAQGRQLLAVGLGIVNGQAPELRHGRQAHGKLGIARPSEGQGLGTGINFRPGDAGEVVHLPLRVELRQLAQQGEGPAAPPIHPGQGRKGLHQPDILLAQGLRGNGGGVRGVILPGNGDGVAECDVRIAGIGLPQGAVVRGALGIHRCQIGKIGQQLHIPLGEMGYRKYFGGAVCVAAGEGNAPKDFCPRHLPAQVVKFVPGNGPGAQVQHLLVLGEQLPAHHHIPFQNKAAHCQNHCQGNHQHSRRNGTGQPFSSHGFSPFHAVLNIPIMTAPGEKVKSGEGLLPGEFCRCPVSFFPWGW